MCREAFQLALNTQPVEARIVLRALSDTDPLVVENGLLAARQHPTPEIVSLLVALVGDPDRSMRLRILGLRALVAGRSPEAFDVLQSLIWERRWFFRRTFADKSALMLEALAAIARHWAREPGAQSLLAVARRSPDPQIRAVARMPQGGA